MLFHSVCIADGSMSQPTQHVHTLRKGLKQASEPLKHAGEGGGSGKVDRNAVEAMQRRCHIGSGR